MLIRSNHTKRLTQPLPIFAAWISKLVNFDIQITITKSKYLATKGTVKKMKLTAVDVKKEYNDLLKKKIEGELKHFPTIELNRGHLKIK